MVMSCDFVDKALSRWFTKIGRFIGQYPGYFVIVPLLVSIIFATGFQRVNYVDDPEYLFSPVDGRSKLERRTIDTLFPMNYSENFNIGRITHKGRFGRVLIVANDGGSVLRSSIFHEIVKLDTIIRNMSIIYDDNVYRYDDLCAKIAPNRCHSNEILDFVDQIDSIEHRKFLLHYPLWINREQLKPYFFPAFLGGVETDDDHFITSAKSISLMYFLDVTVKRGEDHAALWENKFIQIVDSIPLENVSIAKFVSTTLRTELESNTTSLVPFFIITVIIMVVFSVTTCMMADWVQSKPWLGLLGCVSAGLGVAASFGFCIYLGIEMIVINLAAPFLMLGVGMDDAFVLLAAWRRTSPSLSVPDRLGQTYAEAAVSISITSITNFISFIIGTITPFPSVRIFCTYTAVAVFFTYVWHVTFFGGCMAFFGIAEKKNRHGLMCCFPTIPRSRALKQRKSWLFQIMCTGGRDEHDPNNPIDNQEHSMMTFFRDVVAEGLNKTSMKILVIVVFLIYLVIGIYGCTQVKEGLDRRKLSRDDSYSVKYYDYEDRFFREYPYRIQVVVNQTLNYADPNVQEKIDRILSRFESSPYVAESSLTESWLRSYLHFIKQDDSYIFLQSLNLTNQDDFYTGLKSIFLHLPMTESFKNDIVWNSDGTEISATRFIIQTHNITDANMEKEMLLELRRIADEFKDDHVTIFNHLFIFFDQFILVRDISLQTITIAAVIMMAISLFFIPSPSCAIWVAFSIISIEIGVIGYMTHWGVNLDSISMINLIMCIGFSVDFSAHISYAYITCDESSSRDRIKYALHSLGLPIFQGSVSTILGIIALAFAPSYVFLTFFKTVFLVMLFGATHGALLLPVLLSLTDGCFRSNRSDNSDLDAPISKRCHQYNNSNSQSSKSSSSKPSKDGLNGLLTSTTSTSSSTASPLSSATDVPPNCSINRVFYLTSATSPSSPPESPMSDAEHHECHHNLGFINDSWTNDVIKVNKGQKPHHHHIHLSSRHQPYHRDHIHPHNHHHYMTTSSSDNSKQPSASDSDGEIVAPSSSSRRRQSHHYHSQPNSKHSKKHGDRLNGYTADVGLVHCSQPPPTAAITSVALSSMQPYVLPRVFLLPQNNNSSSSSPFQQYNNYKNDCNSRHPSSFHHRHHHRH